MSNMSACIYRLSFHVNILSLTIVTLSQIDVFNPIIRCGHLTVSGSLFYLPLLILLQLESIKNFDFDTWRQRYSTWTRANKAKYMDIFRRIDKEGTGMLTRRQFIDGMLSSSKFLTEMSEQFDHDT